MKIYLILLTLILFLMASLLPCYAQNPIVIKIYPELDTHRISPLIYGSNGQSDDRDENITARRIGGNRLTGYNWENNASNAGTDYINHSDDYLTYISGITGADALKPGIVISAFHDTSLLMNCYSLVTLQAAGYVAADFNGTVAQSETAPSPRWKEIKFSKGSQFSISPDTSDNFVYIDEEVNFLVTKYDRSQASRGIRGYEIDNEPGLWSSTHPRIHPNQPTIAEYISKSSALSKAVKAVDPSAEIFGGVMYGFNEYLTFQNAPDWNSYTSYGTYINAYLSILKDSSDAVGKRLLDVLDLHWYPEAQGIDKSGNLLRITQIMNSDSGVAAAREQAPRTLWDLKYKENSWIAQYYSPVALLPSLNASIAKYNPGTKLAFTEINYGGDSSISGAIAMTDVFGLFGKYDVYFSSYWGPLQSYVASAYKMYRNYDGNKSTFGDIYCKATTSDSASSSVYTSLDSHDSTKLHIIVINKNFNEYPAFNITVNSKKEYGAGELFLLNSGSENISHPKALYQMTNNTFSFTLDPQSISHFIFTMKPNSGITVSEKNNPLQCSNDLSGNISIIRYDVASPASIKIIDIQGRVVKEFDTLHDIGKIEFSGASGAYEVILNDGSHIYHNKILITR
jgi:mannan endo-1,4-beta-mannosidase